MSEAGGNITAVGPAAHWTDEFLTYARRGRNAWWTWVAVPLLAIVLWITANVLATPLVLIARVPPMALQTQMVHPSDPAIFFPVTGFVFGSLMVGLALAARWLQGKRFSDIVGRWNWRLFAAGLGVWTVVLALSTAADALLAPGTMKLTGGPQTVALALLAVVGLAPQTFAEEFIFRGWLTQGLLLGLKRPIPAAAVSAVLFASLHVPNGVPQAVSALVFGFVLSLLAIRFGGLSFTFGLHLVNNLFGAVVVVSAGDVFAGLPGLFAQSAPHLMWWDVGFGAAGLLVVAGLVWRGYAAAQFHPGAPVVGQVHGKAQIT